MEVMRRESLRFLLRQPSSDYRLRDLLLDLAIKLMAFGPLVLPPAHRRLELLPPHFLGAISGSRDGGNHETDHLFRAASRDVHRLDGERNLGFELWGLQF